MDVFTTRTFSQGSDMWTAKPVAVDFPVTGMIVMPAAADHTTPAAQEENKAIGKEARGPHKGSSKTKADSIADEIHTAVANAGATPDTSPRPTKEVMANAIHLIGSVRAALLGTPDVEAYYGEIHLTWQEGRKQIIVICSASRGALIHHYERVKGSTSKHGIEKASSKNLANWLRWLRE